MKVPPGDFLAEKKFGHFSKLRIFKNMAVLSISVHLLFTAYDGLAMLQSTINREQGIGVISQAVAYACYCLSAFVFPKYVIKKVGSKMTIAFSMFTALPYIASNFYSHWAVMMPVSIFIGLGAPLLWGSQAIYLNDISLIYAKLIMDASEKTKFGGNGSARNSLPCRGNSKGRSDRSLSCDPNHFVIYSNDDNNIMLKSSKNIDSKRYSIPFTKAPSTRLIETGIVNQCVDGGVEEKKQMNYGSLKGKEILNRSEQNKENFDLAKSVEPTTQQFETIDRYKVIESTTAIIFGVHGVAFLSSHITSNLMTYYVLQSEIPKDFQSNSSCICGANYCNVDSSCFEQNIVEPSNQIRYILTAACVCIGIFSILIVFLFLDPLEAGKEEVSFSMDLLMATYKLARRKKLLLLIPFSFYIGMVQGFFVGDFNKSFVGCAWGTYHVGLVAVCYGAVSGISAFSSGWLVKRVGRIPIFVTVTLVNLGACGFLLAWRPAADEPHLFFVAAGCWGVFSGTIWSQLRAFYGVLFQADEEAAFAAFHVWFSLGHALSFAYSNYICTFSKIYILISVCILGFAGYLGVELIHLKDKVKN